MIDQDRDKALQLQGQKGHDVAVARRDGDPDKVPPGQFHDSEFGGPSRGVDDRVPIGKDPGIPSPGRQVVPFDFGPFPCQGEIRHVFRPFEHPPEEGFIRTPGICRFHI